MTAKVAQILQNKFTAIRISKSSVTQMAKLRFHYLTIYSLISQKCAKVGLKFWQNTKKP